MKLNVLRRYRAQLEEVVRMDLFRLRQELQDAEARSRLLDEHMKLTTDTYRSKAGGGIALEEFLVWQSMCAAETSNLTAAKQVEGQLREAWNQKQDELRETMQDRRTLDRLAERMARQHHFVQHRVDQMEMDEAARRTSVM
ncbi:MAG TPA: flagellar FliJ family protein [Nitrospiraceae bacterium]|nr:flagellar FliJ family protein [Nitrospiraceae bacterium]